MKQKLAIIFHSSTLLFSNNISISQIKTFNIINIFETIENDEKFSIFITLVILIYYI
jgi:hypothetical protein